MAVVERYALPPGHWLASLQFVPRSDGGEGDRDGYIVAAVAAPGGSQIWVFDASDLARGPLCKLGSPKLSFGMTLHAAWLPTIGQRTAGYYVPVRADYDPLVPSWLKGFFETQVYPHFPQG